MTTRTTYQYRNDTKRIQVVRIPDAVEQFFERVVFPGQRLFFDAFPDDVLEIHSSAIATAILLDHIPCSTLETLTSVTLS